VKSIRGAIGVFGGSFDPPHLGHALLPAWVRARGLVEKIWVAPCADHPLGKTMSPFDDRLTWTQLAMAPYGDFAEVTDLERRLAVEQHGPSFTLRLLERIAAEHPGRRLRLIIGSDIVGTGETARWHQWDRIETEFEPIVVPRAGYASADACALPDVSSTAIRAAAAAGRWDEVAHGVPAAVVEQMQRGRRGLVWLVGRGNVAAHAQGWLRARGYDVVVLSGREPDGGPITSEGAPVGVWIVVRDPGIEDVARRLVVPAGVPVLHAAGALPSRDVLGPLREAGHPVGTLHPICALRRERPWPPRLQDAAFGIEGDPDARAFAEAVLGDQPRLHLDHLDARGRRAYHAACALAANHLAVLQAAAADVLVAQGHAPADVALAMKTLLSSALENLLALGIPDGITGPIVRGDVAAVQSHLAALDPATADLYRALSQRLQSIVTRGS
jgi:nicotinate (nicotinamide) nucleotide adenylyltransferase